MTQGKLKRPVCPACGQLLRPRTDWVNAPREPNSTRPVAGWQYPGNLRVVSRKYDDYPRDPNQLADATTREAMEAARANVERRLRYVTVWDGESFRAVHGYFCTIRCAAEYGRFAYERGHGLRP